MYVSYIHSIYTIPLRYTTYIYTIVYIQSILILHFRLLRFILNNNFEYSTRIYLTLFYCSFVLYLYLHSHTHTYTYIHRYGEKGYGSKIPENQTLVFRVSLVGQETKKP